MAEPNKIHEALLEVAVQNFEEFCALTKFDATRAYVCLLKTKGLSYQQIANKLNMSRDEVRGIYRRRCGCN